MYSVLCTIIGLRLQAPKYDIHIQGMTINYLFDKLEKSVLIYHFYDQHKTVKMS